jgi:hypothetical protein
MRCRVFSGPLICNQPLTLTAISTLHTCRGRVHEYHQIVQSARSQNKQEKRSVVILEFEHFIAVLYCFECSHIAIFAYMNKWEYSNTGPGTFGEP